MAFSHINGALFVYGFVFFSSFFSIVGHPWVFPKSFVKIQFNLAEILSCVIFVTKTHKICHRRWKLCNFRTLYRMNYATHRYVQCLYGKMTILAFHKCVTLYCDLHGSFTRASGSGIDSITSYEEIDFLMHIYQKSGKSNIYWAGPFFTPKYMVVLAKMLIYTHSIRFEGSCCLVLTLKFYHIVSPPANI